MKQSAVTHLALIIAFFSLASTANALSVNVTSPANGYLANTTIVNLNYTVIAVNETVDKCWYTINGGSSNNLTGCLNITITLMKGVNTIRVYANNTGVWKHNSSEKIAYFSSVYSNQERVNDSDYSTYANRTNGAVTSTGVNMVIPYGRLLKDENTTEIRLIGKMTYIPTTPGNTKNLKLLVMNQSSTNWVNVYQKTVSNETPFNFSYNITLKDEMLYSFIAGIDIWGINSYIESIEAINGNTSFFEFDAETTKVINRTASQEVNATINTILNITFDKQANVTMEWATGSQYYENTTEIYDVLAKYPLGTISFLFNLMSGTMQQQLVFYNSNTTDIRENVTVLTVANDQSVKGVVWSTTNTIGDVVVKAYKAIGNTYKLVTATRTDTSGKFVLYLKGGEIYLFTASRQGYNNFSQHKTIVPGSTDLIYIVLVATDQAATYYDITTDCPLVATTPEDCWIYAAVEGGQTVLEFDYWINNTYYGTYAGTVNPQEPEAVFPVTLSNETFQWNISILVNGVLISDVNLKYEEFTSRETQMNVPEGEMKFQEKGFVMIIIMVLMACIAALANKYQAGTGLYVYGAGLTIFSTMIGAFYTAGAIAGIFMIIEAAKRLLG